MKIHFLLYTHKLQVLVFEEHRIDLSSTPRSRRIEILSLYLKMFLLLVLLVGRRDNLNNEDSYRKKNCFFPIVEAVLVELNDRLSVSDMEMLIGILAFCPGSEISLKTEVLKSFAMKMKADFCSLYDEIQVVKSMLNDSKLENIVELNYQLLPLKQEFPTIISLIIATMTVPIPSTICDRAFSKMKLIKTTAPNTMSYNRLSE